MKRVLIAAAIVSAQAQADVALTGFVEGLYAKRVQGRSGCDDRVEACPELANEQRVQLLAEGHYAKGGFGIKTNLWNDAALSQTRVEVLEAFADLGDARPGVARVGRQIVTWGTGEFIYVNDIFPKNYDRFFRGHAFDTLKDSIDGVRASCAIRDWDTEVVLSRPKADSLPDGRRYVGASALPLHTLAQERSGVDVAARVATRAGAWDTAGYAARYRAREQSIVPDEAGYIREGAWTSHLGASITGNQAGGVVWAELAYLHVDLPNTNVNRFGAGSRIKALLGYSKEVRTDITLTAQLQTEHDTNRSGYLASLAPGVSPLKANRALAHLKAFGRFRNQTVTVGAQAFFGSEGDRHLNTSASYSPFDGFSVELGANLFHGGPTTRYGALSDDSNVYLNTRYSF